MEQDTTGPVAAVEVRGILAAATEEMVVTVEAVVEAMRVPVL